MVKSNKGISIIESLVCIVIIGIGFIAIMQLSAFSINSMDRATEKNKLNSTILSFAIVFPGFLNSTLIFFYSFVFPFS